MNWIYSLLAYVGGLFTVALAQQLVARVFGAPRIGAAVKRIALSRTKHRAHKTIPVTDELRLLLAENPPSFIDWDETFTSEHAIDMSILELIEREHRYNEHKKDLVKRRSTLTAQNAKQDVASIGRNMPLLNSCVNALIHDASKAPQIPPDSANRSVVYPLVVKKAIADGRELEFVHLDLPGNPFPIIGSREGRPENNRKAAVLAYALSCCDVPVLADILNLASDFCDYQVRHAGALREALERVKTEKAYLEVVVTLFNRGQSCAHVSCYADVVLGRARQVVKMSRIEEAAPGNEPPPAVVIRDAARRLTDWLPELSQQLRQYESGIENIPVPPSQPIEVHFVSDIAVSRDVIDAVNAMLTGYTNCSLTVWQYVPRRFVIFPWTARFARRVRTFQRITAAR